MYRSHSVGWDIAITENGPVFIEGNGLWEISLVQAVHGGMKKEISSFFEIDDEVFRESFSESLDKECIYVKGQCKEETGADKSIERTPAAI